MKDYTSDVFNWATEALGETNLSPNDAVIKIARKYPDKINTELAKRIGERYNVLKFAERKDQGADIEEDFDITNPEKIEEQLTLNGESKGNVSVKDNSPELDRVPELSDENVYSFYTAKSVPNPFDISVTCKKSSLNDMPAFPVEKNRYSVNKHEWTMREEEDTFDLDQQNAAIKQSQYSSAKEYLNQKVEDYVVKFAKAKAHDPNFVAELKHLRPESPLLEFPAAKKLASAIPYSITGDHKEFLEMDDVVSEMFKLGGVTKKKSVVKEALKVPNVPKEEMKEQKEREKALKEFKKKHPYKYKALRTLQFLGDITAGTYGAAETIHGVSGIGNKEITVNGKPATSYGALGTANQHLKGLAQPFLQGVYGNPYLYGQGIGSAGLTALLPKALSGDDSLSKKRHSNIQKRTRNALKTLHRKGLFEKVVEENESLKGGSIPNLLNVYKDISVLAPDLSLKESIVNNLLEAANAYGKKTLDLETALNLVSAEKKISTGIPTRQSVLENVKELTRDI